MIPKEVMRELRYIEVYAAKRIRNLRVGPYTSPLRGPGFDFDEHQPYRQGDDVRRIDWNVTARMNAPYVRHTHAERELNVMIAVDVSRSMDLGTSSHSKKEVMTFITASLLFSALSDQINTGFVAFADKVISYTAPRRARPATWNVLEQCWAATSTSGRTKMIPVIDHLMMTLKRTSVIFIVSDFMTDDEPLTSRELSMLAARHDVIAIVPEDRAELQLPAGSGYVTVKDLETRRKFHLGLGRGTRRRYAEEASRRRDALAAAFYRVPMDHVFVPSDGNAVEPVLSLFARRMNG